MYLWNFLEVQFSSASQSLFFLKEICFFLSLSQKKIKKKMKNDPYPHHSDDPLFLLIKCTWKVVPMLQEDTEWEAKFSHYSFPHSSFSSWRCVLFMVSSISLQEMLNSFISIMNAYVYPLLRRFSQKLRTLLSLSFDRVMVWVCCCCSVISAFKK